MSLSDLLLFELINWSYKGRFDNVQDFFSGSVTLIQRFSLHAQQKEGKTK